MQKPFMYFAVQAQKPLLAVFRVIEPAFLTVFIQTLLFFTLQQWRRRQFRTETARKIVVRPRQQYPNISDLWVQTAKSWCIIQMTEYLTLLLTKGSSIHML